MGKLQMVKDGHLGGYIQGGDPGTWCPNLWTWAVNALGIKSVLDVGCGEGHSARFFQNLGCEILGVEGCQKAIDESVIPGHVVQHDFCSGPFIPDQPIDLVWSCEFLEHVEERFVPNILKTFSYARKAILITHAFPGQDDGHHHVNCRPSSYWIKQIESVGFRCDRPRTHQARTVTLNDYHGINHFARSGLFFCRQPDHVERIGELRPAGNGPFWSGIGKWLGAEFRAFQIQTGFRFSSAYREHRRKRRAARRAGRKFNKT